MFRVGDLTWPDRKSPLTTCRLPIHENWGACIIAVAIILTLQAAELYITFVERIDVKSRVNMSCDSHLVMCLVHKMSSTKMRLKCERWKMTFHASVSENKVYQHRSLRSWVWVPASRPVKVVRSDLYLSFKEGASDWSAETNRPDPICSSLQAFYKVVIFDCTGWCSWCFLGDLISCKDDLI
jgi:hypothetical protein